MQWDSAFPGGNGKLLRATRESWGWDIAFLAESKAREPQPLWFSFRLRGIDGGKLRLRLANSALCLGGLEEWERNRPVYRFPGGTWQRAVKTIGVPGTRWKLGLKFWSQRKKWNLLSAIPIKRLRCKIR